MDIIKESGGTLYWLNPTDGNDENDGLTPETAWKTIRATRERIGANDKVKMRLYAQADIVDEEVS